ncbi:MAG TPA: tyrosine-type recombinase/integrase [Candidatus Brocadiia bacterium]|nr:tyrosine-type recombinase/integrase [Candidatus Brocadiia bacterium]
MADKKISLQHRANGNWEARWRPDGVNGVQCSRTFKTKKRAQAFVQFLDKQMNAGFLNLGKPIPWEEFIVNHWLPYAEGLREKNRDDYNTTIKRFRETINPQTITGISTTDIEQFKVSMIQAKLAPRTINKHLQQLSRVFDLARRWELIDKNPGRLIDREKRPSRPAEIITEDDFRKLLSAAPSEEWRLFLKMGWLLGLRITDLRKLEWQQFDLKVGVLSHIDRKTQRQHPRPLPPDVVRLLSEIPESQREGPLFPSFHRMSVDHFARESKVIRDAAKVKTELRHFRSALVSRLAALGYHPTLIGAWTLQTPEVLLRHYTRVDELRPVADAVRLPVEHPEPPSPKTPD